MPEKISYNLCTSVFDRLQEAYLTGKYHGFIEEGGSRSSKTYSIIQFWIYYATLNVGKRKRVFVCRAVGTWVTGSVLFDFLQILDSNGISSTSAFAFNKTVRIIKLFGTEFWFFGLDDQQKIHGMTSDAFWINEAMEGDNDSFDQLEQRCAEFFILDYNPSATEHWIYDKVCTRSDVSVHHSTMLDNDFLPENMRRKIMSYEPNPENDAIGTSDKNKWDIYGLGLRSEIEGLIFTKITLIDNIPEYIPKERRFTGLDFGFTNDPTAIEEVAYQDNSLYINELCYETFMMGPDIIRRLKLVNDGRRIISESADPRLVREISNAGFNIKAVNKATQDGKGSIMAGIDKMKSMQIFVTKRSMNIIKEFKNYKFRKDVKSDRTLNVPVDDFNHAIDGARYVVLEELLGKGSGGNARKVASMLG